MAKYVVTVDVLGLPSEPAQTIRRGKFVEVVRPTYHRRGEVLDLDPSEAEERVSRGALKAVADVEAEEKAKAKVAEDAEKAQADALQAKQDRLDAENAAKAPTGEGEKLTAKQALIKEAEELGLNTEGTSAELTARIEAKKVEQE